jgi:hypothetical protein
VKIRATAAAIGILPVTVAGLMLMACGLRWEPWVLLSMTAAFYFIWIRRAS